MVASVQKLHTSPLLHLKYSPLIIPKIPLRSCTRKSDANTIMKMTISKQPVGKTILKSIGLIKDF